jgi:hypothetical protein
LIRIKIDLPLHYLFSEVLSSLCQISKKLLLTCLGPFFDWYNHDHYHTALGLLTPASVHYGHAEAIRTQRQQVLQAAYAAHPERFVRGLPTPPDLPTEVWINRPANKLQLLDDLTDLFLTDPDSDLFLPEPVTTFVP